MKHMEIALSQEGVTEVVGPGSSTNVLSYFKLNGRAEITNDEVPWCAAFYFWVLQKAGVDVSSIEPKDRLLAVSALRLGTRISEPRVGCGVVMKRPGGHHVGFVTGWTETTIWIFGGNQANSVNEMERKRSSDMVFMWPIPPATATDLAASSSTVAATGRQQSDAKKASAPQIVDAAVPAPPEASFPPPDALIAKGQALEGWVSAAESFALFAWGKLSWIALAVSLYYLARMAWDAGWIQAARVKAHNTGKSLIAAPARADAPQNEEVSLV
jgi:uncharacterized protein (TIGR02594 family)